MPWGPDAPPGPGGLLDAGGFAGQAQPFSRAVRQTDTATGKHPGRNLNFQAVAPLRRNTHEGHQGMVGAPFALLGAGANTLTHTDLRTPTCMPTSM